MVGKTLGHYRLEKLLARGTVEVYLGRDERLERPVAVKTGAQATMQAPFQAEAHLTATLDHPNILPIYDVGAQAGVAYLVMHYASGGSLRDRLNATRTNGGLPLEEVAYYLDQAAAALDYTHTRGMIHCNLKPSNLLLRERWLMLGDFGQALKAGSNGPAAHPTLQGNLVYVSPEQYGGKPVGPPADLYALGILLYQLLWGSTPPSDTTSMMKRSLESITPGTARPLPPLAGAGPRQIEAIKALIARATAPRPEERHPSAGALAAEFRGIIAAPGIWSSAALKTPEDFPVICPTCGFLNKPQARFCRNDGTRLPIICPRCGAMNRFEAKFCQNDGTNLARLAPPAAR